MKTIRTILGTLAVIVLGYGLLAVISFRANSAFLQRSLYQIFAQSYFVALVLGVAFLLIAIILTVALMSFRDDEREEREEQEQISVLDDDDDEETVRPASGGQGAFRRPARLQTADEDEPEQPEDDADADVPAFLKKGATRPRVKEKTAPNVESIFDDLDDDATAAQAPRKEVKHCTFCNAVIDDDSKTCPSCGKRL